MRFDRPLILVAFVGLLATAGPSAAQVTEIYKCMDKAGRPLYTSDRKDIDGKRCELVSREVNVVPSQRPTPAPKVGGFRGSPLPSVPLPRGASATSSSRSWPPRRA